MSNTDKLFHGSLASFGRNTIEVTRTQGNIPATIRIFISILGILLCTGAEGMKVIFRNNFGRHGVNLTRVVICSICFGVVSYFAFNDEDFGLEIDNSAGTSISFFITGIVYAFLSVYVFIKGIICKVNAYNENPNSVYPGDIRLLNFLGKYFNRSLIEFFAEPFYTVIIGALLYLYNPISGIPLIFCGLSIWVNALFDLMLGNLSFDSMRNDLNSTHEQKLNTNQVISD